MRLTEILNRDTILPNLIARNKTGALAELCGIVAAAEKLDAEPLLKVILEREKLGSTGLGDGIALPHGRVDRLPKILMAFGRSLEGVVFDSMDGKPAHLFFLILTPLDSTGLHLRLLARLSKLLQEPSFRKDIFKARGREEIYQLIAVRDNEL